MEKYFPHISIAIAITVFVLAQFKTRSMSALEVRMITLETKVGLYWSAVEKNAAAILHSPHRPEMDKIWDKHLAGIPITQDEARQLVGMLQEIISTKDGNPNQLFMAQQVLQVTIAKYGLGEFIV